MTVDEEKPAVAAQAIVRRPLLVFVVHDDPTEEMLSEERWWAAIVAEDERQAVAIAAAIYNGDGPLNEIHWNEFFGVGQPIDPSSWHERYRPTAPQRLTDCESLREVGFHEEGEESCDSCGQYAMGMPDCYVCPECRNCVECGGCECEKAD